MVRAMTEISRQCFTSQKTHWQRSTKNRGGGMCFKRGPTIASLWEKLQHNTWRWEVIVHLKGIAHLQKEYRIKCSHGYCLCYVMQCTVLEKRKSRMCQECCLLSIMLQSVNSCWGPWEVSGPQIRKTAWSGSCRSERSEPRLQLCPTWNVPVNHSTTHHFSDDFPCIDERNGWRCYCLS